MLKKVIAMLLTSIMVLSGTVMSFAENDNNGKRYMMAERTMSVSSPEIIKSTDSSGTPARAEMGFDFSGFSDVGSYSGVVGITLTKGGPNAY